MSHQHRVAVAALCVVALMPSLALSQCTVFAFSLSAVSTVPPSGAVGTVSVQASLCGDAHFTGHVSVVTTETVTNIDIHGPASGVENGPVLYTLPPLVGGQVIFDVGPLSEELQHEIDLGRVYVDAHTLEHPNGAFRGVIRGEVSVAIERWDHIKSLYR